MAEVQFEVLPFGDRWAVLKEVRQLSMHRSYQSALSAAEQAAARQQAGGADCRILVRDRAGEWREAPCPDIFDYVLDL
jgi:hypothetical protein